MSCPNDQRAGAGRKGVRRPVSRSNVWRQPGSRTSSPVQCAASLWDRASSISTSHLCRAFPRDHASPETSGTYRRGAAPPGDESTGLPDNAPSNGADHRLVRPARFYRASSFSTVRSRPCVVARSRVYRDIPFASPCRGTASETDPPGYQAAPHPTGLAAVPSSVPAPSTPHPRATGAAWASARPSGPAPECRLWDGRPVPALKPPD